MARASKSGKPATLSADRTRQIMDMKTQGFSFQEIGDKLGITRQSAHELYWSERARWQAEKALAHEELDAERDSSVARVKRTIAAWYPWAAGLNDDPDNPGMKILDKDAAAIVLKYEERLASLMGLDAPKRADITSGNKALGASTIENMDRYTDEELAALEAVHKAAQLRLAGPDTPV